MKTFRRLILGLLVTLGLIRAIGYLAYAVLILPSPVETYFLEAKMVLLAYRAKMGLTLYPDWRDYPHVADFFSPFYFLLVGLIGRLAQADLDGLFTIGRSVSFGSGLLTSVVVGWMAARRYGKWLGMAGGVLSLGTLSMIGFSVMTRPDLFAELLGVVGFALAISHRSWVRGLGGVVLILAILTKQTTAIFLAASVLAWLAEGLWRTGLTLGVGSGLILVGIVGLVTWGLEPNFARALLGESQTPWDLDAWSRTLIRFCAMAPDTIYFPLVGLVLWSTCATGRRDAPLAILAALIMVTSVVTSAKVGADSNYYLSLRVLEALAVGGLWQAWSISVGRLRSTGLGSLAVVGCLTLALPAYSSIQQAVGSWRNAQVLSGPYGRGLVRINQEMEAMATDPAARILTDSGLFDLYARENAVFGDPWLFRMLTNTGRIDPVVLRDRIDAQYYNLVVTTSELHLPKYDAYEFGLPKTLADQVRARYVFSGTRGALFLYERRPNALAPAPGSP